MNTEISHVLDRLRRRIMGGGARSEPLKLVLHVGPHKTGTTSLQTALLRQYGSKRPRSIWYPLPPSSGPGHALIARKTVRPTRHVDSPHPDVGAIMEAARKAGCGTLILSSEDFAVAYPATLDLLFAQIADTDLHIVVSLSPVGQRAVSIWQELIKHKSSQSLADEESVALRHPGLAPDFTRSFAAQFPAAKISVLIANRAEPKRLFDLFSSATGIKLAVPRGKERTANPSLGRVEAEMLRAFNISAAELSLADEKYRRGRGMLRSLFKSEAWRAAVPFVPLRPPQAWTAPLQRQCRETIHDLMALAAEGRIDIFGDLAELDDVGASEGDLADRMAASEEGSAAAGTQAEASAPTGIVLPITRQA